MVTDTASRTTVMTPMVMTPTVVVIMIMATTTGRRAWDADTDNYAQEVYMNKSLFCIATVFGIYHY